MNPGIGVHVPNEGLRFHPVLFFTHDRRLHPKRAIQLLRVLAQVSVSTVDGSFQTDYRLSKTV